MATAAATEGPTRAGFVREQPLDMSVEDVIKAGAKRGLEIKPGDVHAARYYMRQMESKEKATKGTKGGKKASASESKKAKEEPVAAKKSTNGHAKTATKRVVKRAAKQAPTAQDSQQALLEFRSFVTRIGTIETRKFLDMFERGDLFID